MTTELTPPPHFDAPDVLSRRMRPNPVVLRLLASPTNEQRYLVVNWPPLVGR